ncbi:MAG TPA: nuclear transport factor 2 family protein [Solirubrobacterales bacterium]|nr:nuclear transport factor 2 family protein [Solirubrobacterales bacterium]
MTDPYDSFEQARLPVERPYELGNELVGVGLDSGRGREIESEVRALFAEDLEHVTRDGVVRGPEHFLSDYRVQLSRFDISFEIDVREGVDSVVVLLTARRQMRDSSDYLVVYSGAVFRVRDGRIVFMEGYPDGRDALRAAGVKPRPT